MAAAPSYGGVLLTERTVRSHASPYAKWKYVQWILQTAALPSVRIYRIDLREHEDTTATRIDLPADAPYMHEQLEVDNLVPEDLPPSDPSAAPEVGPAPPFSIRFFRRNFWEVQRAHTHIRIGERKLDLARHSRPGEPAYEASMRTVERALEEALAAQSPKSILISAPPPKGPRVPYGDVLRVIRKIQALGSIPIRLEGSAIPLRRR